MRPPIPPCPTKPNLTPKSCPSYDIELITPMVGGGATPGVIDPDFPIRPTAIRGHLRHWWRLMRGFSLGEAMWQREEEIFGSTEFPSPISVSVELLTKPEQFKQFNPADGNLVRRSDPVAYALFASIENKHLVVKEGIQFRLTIQTTDDGKLLKRRKALDEQRGIAGQRPLTQAIAPIANDVNEALTAWMSFGGIGGRTRRGCGAIHCQNLAESFPQVPARIFVGPGQRTPIAAWQESLTAYRAFRQTPRGKKHNKTLRNGTIATVDGRSHWPEADSIRKITACSLKPLNGVRSHDVPADEDVHDHSIPVVPSNVLPAFPKAILGLPINFHFADGPNKGNAVANLDPKDVRLYPLLPTNNGRLEKADRMASPILTRPIWRDGKWLPAVIILPQQLPDGFPVRVEGRNAALNGNLSLDLPASSVVGSSLKVFTPMRGKASAIEALIAFLGALKYEEVRP